MTRLPAVIARVDRELTRLARTRAGILLVQTPGVVGAEVLLNGRVVGVTPLNLAQKPGLFQLMIRKKGYSDHVVSITIRPGKRSKHIVTLNVRLVQITIRIPGVSDARVTLDGKPVGPSPVTLRRKPGRYQLAITKNGYRPYRETLRVAEGAITRSITLVQLRRPSKNNRLRLAAYITGGIGLGLIIGGGVFHGLAVKDRNVAGDSKTVQPVALDKYNSSKSKMKAAYALYGVGGAALVAGIVMLVLDLTRKPKSDEQVTGRTLMLYPTLGGASLRMTFD